MTAPWSRGGPKVGTAPHPRQPREWIRSEAVRVTFRPSELEDLRELAAGWGVPVATAIWALVHERLAHFKRVAPQHGKQGLAIAAGLATLGVAPRSQTEEADR